MDPSNPSSPSTPAEPSQVPPAFDPKGSVESINSDEVKIADIRRQPFGLFVIYLQFILALTLSLGLIFALLPDVLKTLGLNRGSASVLAIFLGFLVVMLGLIFLFLATRIYQSNRLIITNSNITQVRQIGLFNRKASELAMHSIEDVIAGQKGIFQTIFNYGTLTIATAGPEENFIFNYCPNPNAYAKVVLDARATYLENRDAE